MKLQLQLLMGWWWVLLAAWYRVSNGFFWSTVRWELQYFIISLEKHHNTETSGLQKMEEEGSIKRMFTNLQILNGSCRIMKLIMESEQFLENVKTLLLGEKNISCSILACWGLLRIQVLSKSWKEHPRGFSENWRNTEVTKWADTPIRKVFCWNVLQHPSVEMSCLAPWHFIQQDYLGIRCKVEGGSSTKRNGLHGNFLMLSST